MYGLLVCVLSLAASTLGYTVSIPNASKGWTNEGAQTLTWTRVATDSSNFTAVLTNVDRSVLSENNQVLAALVVGTLGTTALNPPSGGWPLGNGFRVNLVKDTEDLNTIYAQSDEFSIMPPQNTSSYSMTTISSSPIIQPTNSATFTIATTAASGSSSSASTNSSSGSSNGALRFGDGHTSLWAVLGLLGFFLA
ncbi:hypothetical protein AX15_002349 [Amanita polypyramis BW_CC]|nr:hypothetical protein AX15_002349 [Amanita polypyramis BW_CC]